MESIYQCYELTIKLLLLLLLLETDNEIKDKKVTYQSVKGSITTFPTNTFFRAQKKKNTHFSAHVSSNYVQQLTSNNTRCHIVPIAHTDQFKN